MRPYSLFILGLLLLFAPVLSGQEEASIKISPPAGFYERAQSITFSGGDAGAVHYTKDGSTPTDRSPVYDGQPIRIEKSSVVRAVRYQGGKRIGYIHGASYLISEPKTKLMTISVGIDGWRLFDPVSGWFNAGPGIDPTDWKQFSANWWTKKEHAVHLDIIEASGEHVHGSTVGFRMFGGMSRIHPQKSFSLSARSVYGDKRINYPLFGEEEKDSFRFLVVRNGGSDWGRSYIRDALLTGLLRDRSWDLERQAARPIQVYLNGKYWGVYHLREKINPRYLADHHDVNKDSLILLEHQLTRKHGTVREYQELHDFISQNDLSDPVNYARLGRLMDIDNFQRLQIAQTFFDNRDAGGNIRYWRPMGPGHRFRWILYDVDQGFGLHRDEGWKNNTLLFYTDGNGPQWPNPPWSTLFQRRLLTNDAYRRGFVNRTLDYLHTDFSSEAVSERTEAAIEAVAADMPRQLDRWDGKVSHWEFHLDRLRNFGVRRQAFLREHLREFFQGGADRDVEVAAGRGGYVVLNDNLHVGSDGLRGSYFANYPLSVVAVPEPGYLFAGWEGNEAASAELELHISRAGSYELRATFEASRHELADQIIINEVSPRNPAGDWLELYNRGEVVANLAGWFLTDHGDRRFYLPAVRLHPGEYLVVCRREEKFRETYPSAYGVVTGLNFGLSKSQERLGLYAADGSYVNTMSYDIEASDDSLYTYALALPGLDNSRHRNWVTEVGPGTPGAANPEHLQRAVVGRQNFWLRIGVGVSVMLLVGIVRTMHPRARP